MDFRPLALVFLLRAALADGLPDQRQQIKDRIVNDLMKSNEPASYAKTGDETAIRHRLREIMGVDWRPSQDDQAYIENFGGHV